MRPPTLRRMVRSGSKSPSPEVEVEVEEEEEEEEEDGATGGEPDSTILTLECRRGAATATAATAQMASEALEATTSEATGAMGEAHVGTPSQIYYHLPCNRLSSTRSRRHLCSITASGTAAARRTPSTSMKTATIKIIQCSFYSITYISPYHPSIS
jgi:hypothetical protein